MDGGAAAQGRGLDQRARTEPVRAAAGGHHDRGPVAGGERQQALRRRKP
ncbi:hypothetical protein [Streptomyces sp. CS62]